MLSRSVRQISNSPGAIRLEPPLEKRPKDTKPFLLVTMLGVAAVMIAAAVVWSPWQRGGSASRTSAVSPLKLRLVEGDRLAWDPNSIKGATGAVLTIHNGPHIRAIQLTADAFNAGEYTVVNSGSDVAARLQLLRGNEVIATEHVRLIRRTAPALLAELAKPDQIPPPSRRPAARPRRQGQVAVRLVTETEDPPVQRSPRVADFENHPPPVVSETPQTERVTPVEPSVTRSVEPVSETSDKSASIQRRAYTPIKAGARAVAGRVGAFAKWTQKRFATR